MKIKIAIQCMDGRTKQKGTFGYKKTVNTITEKNVPYSTTPVFTDLVELFNYMKINNISECK